MNPRFVWPSVALAAVGAVVACVMALARVDTAVIVTVLSLLITPVLGALLVGQVSELKASTAQVVTQTNGNLGRLLDLVEKQSGQLAAAPPAAPVDEQRAA
ncbi:MAG TPA: hypothetical protein VHA75_21255 [Rugosimonospora sp.]|nr:hypothetical protein [Rugosimonospora sp.]